MAETAGTGLLRPDLAPIAAMIEPGSRVLDIGCGDGELLEYLVRHREVTGRGMEIAQDGVNACVARGLSVIQGDADTDLADYPDAAFDYVVLTFTLQATRDPRQVLSEMLRIGRHGIVSITNYAYWPLRLELLFRGRVPTSEVDRMPWYASGNIRRCTIRDFELLCRELNLAVESRIGLNGRDPDGHLREARILPNLLARQAIYLLRRRSSG